MTNSQGATDESPWPEYLNDVDWHEVFSDADVKDEAMDLPENSPGMGGGHSSGCLNEQADLAGCVALPSLPCPAGSSQPEKL